MSGLQTRGEEQITGVDVREQGSALRVASSTPHLVSLGTGRLSTAVTLHPIKQGRVTIGSEPTSDIYVAGTGVASLHCRIENSHGVLTLYPISGSTLLDGLAVDKPTRLSQGSMLTIGRSNYLRFNHPEEAKLMKSVLPSGHVSMAPVQFQPNEQCSSPGYMNQQQETHNYQASIMYRDNTLSQLDHELDVTLKEMSRKKPPVAPRKPCRDLDMSDSNSDQESRPKLSSIMAKVSKFEYYAKQHKSVGRSQFYTTNENEISPKVFRSNSLTVNTPAKDVIGKHVPNFMRKEQTVVLTENNSVDPRNCSYANVAIKKTNIDDIVRNFNENTRNEYKLPKKINNDQVTDNLYGKINIDKNNFDAFDSDYVDHKNELYARVDRNVNSVKLSLPSPNFDRNPQYSPVYANCNNDRCLDSENRRMKAYQDRIKEQEQKQAETARLEEILNMCAEYERQISSGTPITPTEKRSHNKIITNGSLPRSVAMNNPNFVQTSEGYYKFETSHRNNSMSQSLPTQKHLSSYENYDVTTPHLPSDVSNQSYDEIGIPVLEEQRLNELSSPIMIRKMNQNNLSPICSPYENVYKNNFKPKSPITQSPRTRIKTSFAHKNLPSPQYFVFPTPPPKDNLDKPNFDSRQEKFNGIEKQLSLEEDIPMIDDVTVTNDIELRYSKVEKDETKESNVNKVIVNNKDEVKADDNNDTEINVTNVEKRLVCNEKTLAKNQSFDDVKKELMADIPELEEVEKDLKENKRDNIIKNITDDIRKMDIEAHSIDSVLDDNGEVLKNKFDSLKEERKKLIAEIHEIKCKMSEIRSQEDDILRELEMEKALIKGEYDSEIAILNIEQKKKIELVGKGRKIEEEIQQLKEKQESRQNEMRDRVEIATLKVERIGKDLKGKSATTEELQNAQDILDNETKMFEDLEFQHLEEESELLANREDLQNEIIALTKKVEAQKTRILRLKSEANSNLTSALHETKILQAEYVRLLNQVEDSTGKLTAIEKELKPIIAKLNDLERTQSPDSAFYTDQTRAKSGEFGYSPQSSDDDVDLKINNFEDHRKSIKDKFNSIDQMSQSMIVDIERRIIIDDSEIESPTKTSSCKEKKGFWERNFDSLKRKKKPKSPEKTDIMSQSLNENMFYNDNIENDSFDRFNSLRNSKNKKKDSVIKSNSSSKIPTFAAFGKIIKKDSFGKKSKDKDNYNSTESKNRYVKNTKQIENNKYKSKSLSPDKVLRDDDVITEENEIETNAKEPKEAETPPKVFHRKSCGDEPSRNSMDFQKIGDSGKIPSQDDIDRISKVTIDAPILPNDIDNLGKKTLDSLMEIERKRMVLLEEQGCQMIENEREKISELKRRVQVETRKQWEMKQREKSFDGDQLTVTGLGHNDSRVDDALNVSSVFDDSSGLMSSSIEELHVRNSRTDTEDDKRSDDSRPLSNASDFSRDNILSLPGAPRRSRRVVAPYCGAQRPLTRYLPVDRDDFDLRTHIESAGHQIELCPHVTVGATSCRGYLHKLGAKFHTWSKRWFVFDRETKTFVYYWDKTEKKPRGGAYFQVIQEVYLDHGNTSKSPNPQTTFIVKTRQRKYYLMAPSGEAARIWIDVVFTGAQGYTEYLE